jgi:hypothetical protein
MSRSRITIITVGVVIIAIATGFLVYQFFFNRPTEFSFDDWMFDTNALEGRIKLMSNDEIIDELNRIVRDGLFNISISSNIMFGDADGEGYARIENIPQNKYFMKVDIMLDEVGDAPVYSSALIKPGYFIETIKLNTLLPAGDWPGLVEFSAYTMEEGTEPQYVGKAGVRVKVTIYNSPLGEKLAIDENKEDEVPTDDNSVIDAQNIILESEIQNETDPPVELEQAL